MTSAVAGRVPARTWTIVADGARLRSLRHQRGLSQARLAHLAGLSEVTVARVERRPRSTCRGRTLARLAAALQVHPHDLAAPEAQCR